jgi:CRP-like cAMP-binding protein
MRQHVRVHALTVDRGSVGGYAPTAIPEPFELSGGDHIRQHRIPKQQIDLLKAVPLFSGCSQGELRTIAQLGTPVSVEKGKVLITKGAIGQEFFLVLSGLASCRLGKRQVDQFTTGGYFGELALLHGGIRTADVVAETAMELLALDRREFQAMLMTTPHIGIKMLDRLADRLGEADAHYSD